MRQLNFYGFRKIKSDPIRINAQSIENKWWRFRHEKFLRGRPELLCEIKKASQSESAEKQEVDSLKVEVTQLKSRMATMANDIDKLTSLVKNMIVNQDAPMIYESALKPGSKKRKIVEMPMPMDVPSSALPIQPVAPIVPLHVSSNLIDTSNELDSDLFVEEAISIDPFQNKYMPGSVAPLKEQQPVERYESVGSMTAVDQDLLDLFQDEINNELGLDNNPVLPDVHTSIDKLGQPYSPQKQADPALVRKLHDSLTSLPPAMQQIFVERLVATVSDPDAFDIHIEAIKSLATTAAEEAKKRVIQAQKDKTNEKEQNGEEQVTLPLAAATLGAFLAQYSATLQQKATEEHREGMFQNEKVPSIVPMEG